MSLLDFMDEDSEMFDECILSILESFDERTEVRRKFSKSLPKNDYDHEAFKKAYKNTKFNKHTKRTFAKDVTKAKNQLLNGDREGAMRTLEKSKAYTDYAIKYNSLAKRNKKQNGVSTPNRKEKI